MIINLRFDYGIDIIEIPSNELTDIKKLRSRFDKWCYNKDNSRTFDKKNRVFCYDGNTFIWWLNNIEKCPAKILIANTYDYDDSLPTLNF